MIQIEESNPIFESCSDCIYSDDSEDMCILRRCIHAVAQLKECYVPKQPTIESQRTGRWEYIDYGGFGNYHCSACRMICICNGDYDYCPNCGASMEGEG